MAANLRLPLSGDAIYVDSLQMSHIKNQFNSASIRLMHLTLASTYLL